MDLKVDEITSRSARVSWTPAFDGSSRIIKYVVLVLEESPTPLVSWGRDESPHSPTDSPSSSSTLLSSDRLSNKSSSSSIPGGLTTTTSDIDRSMAGITKTSRVGKRSFNHTVLAEETSFLLTNLAPDCNYSVSLIATNALGSSEASQSLRFRTDEEGEGGLHLRS